MMGWIDMSWFWTKRTAPARGSSYYQQGPYAPTTVLTGAPGSTNYFRPASKKTLLHDWRRYDGLAPIWIGEDATFPVVGDWIDWEAL